MAGTEQDLLDGVPVRSQGEKSPLHFGHGTRPQDRAAELEAHRSGHQQKFLEDGGVLKKKNKGQEEAAASVANKPDTRFTSDNWPYTLQAANRGVTADGKKECLNQANIPQGDMFKRSLSEEKKKALYNCLLAPSTERIKAGRRRRRRGPRGALSCGRLHSERPRRR